MNDRATQPRDLPEEERKRLAEALDAELVALSEQIRRRNSPERAALDQARMEQRSVLRFVDEVFNRRGFSFLHIEDTTETTHLIHDALRTVHLLIVCEGQHMESDEWETLRERLGELEETFQLQTTWRLEDEAELRAGEGGRGERVSPNEGDPSPRVA